MIGFATLADQVKPFKNILYLILPWTSLVEGKTALKKKIQKVLKVTSICWPFKNIIYLFLPWSSSVGGKTSLKKKIQKVYLWFPLLVDHLKIFYI